MPTIIAVNLDDLLVPDPRRNGVEAYGKLFRNSGLICFEANEHSPTQVVTLSGDQKGLVNCNWGLLDSIKRAAYSNHQKRAENGAVGVTVLVFEILYSMYFLEEAPADGQGFDYWTWDGNGMLPAGLSEEDAYNELLKRRKWRVEISGIAKGKESVAERFKEKEKRFPLGPAVAPTYVSVVSFCVPETKIGRVR